MRASSSKNGYQYRCIITNDSTGEQVISRAATLTFYYLFVYSQPQDVYAQLEETVTFTYDVETNLPEENHLQWQFSSDKGQNWSNISGATAEEYSVTAYAAYDGYQYRCVVMDEEGNITHPSDVATLTVVMGFIVQKQPVSVWMNRSGVNESTYASFSFGVFGVGKLRYQWQASGDNGESWSDLPNATGAEYSLTELLAFNGYLFRCIVTDAAADSMVSHAATLTVYGFSVQPQDVVAEVGETATFSAEFLGEEPAQHAWYFSRDNGTTWKQLDGETNSVYSVKAIAARNGYRYLCKVKSGTRLLISKDVSLTVTGLPEVTVQPKNVTAVEGWLATFSCGATGEGLSYRWQYRESATAEWFDIPNATAATCSVQASDAIDGYQYKCIVTNANGGTAVTDIAALTVKAPSTLSGDTNQNGKPEAVDAQLALQAYVTVHLTNLPSPLTAAQIVNADMDGDGDVTLRDALAILE